MSRLNYRATALLLLALSALVTTFDWVGNGHNITCAIDGKQDDWVVPKNILNNYCYITATFTLVKDNEVAGDQTGLV